MIIFGGYCGEGGFTYLGDTWSLSLGFISFFLSKKKKKTSKQIVINFFNRISS